MLLSLLSILALGQDPSVPPGTARVTDARSHGALGDGRLSLDEAIRVVAGSLQRGVLDTSEAAAIGAGAVTRIEIDAAIVPAIDVELPLSPLLGDGFHAIAVEGMPNGAGALPVLRGASLPFVLAVRTDRATVKGLAIEGGNVGIHVETPQNGRTADTSAVVEHCELRAQLDAGVVLRGQGALLQRKIEA